MGFSPELISAFLLKKPRRKCLSELSVHLFLLLLDSSRYMTETHIHTQKWNHQQFESIQFASVAGCRRWTHLTCSFANQTDGPKRTQFGDGPCGWWNSQWGGSLWHLIQAEFVKTLLDRLKCNVYKKHQKKTTTDV